MQAEQEIAHFNIPPVTRRLAAAAGAVTMAGGSAIVACSDPATANFFPICPVYALTGFACPGCGLTRGFHALFHGDVLNALDFNALIPVWALIFGYAFVSMLLLAVRGRGLPISLTSIGALWAFLIVLLVFSVLRNLPVYPFTILFP